MNRGRVVRLRGSLLLAGALCGCASSEPPPPPPPVEEAEPRVAEPPVAEPPVAEPPVSEPPVAEPPVAEPPVAEPPVAEPPVSEPPVSDAERGPDAAPSDERASVADATAPEPTPPAALLLEATVPDLFELRHDLTFVKGVPSLSPPDDGAPASLRDPDAAPAAEGVFVRLREVWLGGELDAAGDEEVRVIVTQGEASATLLARTLDLGSELEGFPFRDAPWVELADGETPLELEVVEEDETDDEPMTSTLEPVGLPLPASPGEEALHEVELGPIEATEVRLFRGSRKIRLEGARAMLGLIRAPRRDEPDAAERRRFDEAFAPLRAAPRGDAPDVALALARGAAEAGDDAMEQAARSTDAWTRREVPPLAAEARRLAIVAATVAQADPEKVQAAQAALGRAIAGLSPDEAARPDVQAPLAAARALAEPPVVALALDAVREGAARADQLEDALRDALFERDSDALDQVASALHELRDVLRRAARGLELTTVMSEGRLALEAHLVR